MADPESSCSSDDDMPELPQSTTAAASVEAVAVEQASSSEEDGRGVRLPAPALSENGSSPDAAESSSEDGAGETSTTSSDSSSSSPIPSPAARDGRAGVQKDSMVVRASRSSVQGGQLSPTEKKQFKQQFQNIQGQMNAERAAMEHKKAEASRRTRERVLQRKASRTSNQASTASAGGGSKADGAEQSPSSVNNSSTPKPDGLTPTDQLGGASGSGPRSDVDIDVLKVAQGQVPDFGDEMPVNKLITKELERRRAARQEKLRGFLSEFEREKVQNESQMDILRNMMALDGYDVSVPGLEKELEERVRDQGRDVLGVKLPGLKGMSDEELDKMEAIVEKIKAAKAAEEQRKQLRKANQRKMDKLREQMAIKERRVAEIRAEQAKLLRQQRLQALRARREKDGLPDLPEEDLEAELEEMDEQEEEYEEKTTAVGLETAQAGGGGAQKVLGAASGGEDSSSSTSASTARLADPDVPIDPHAAAEQVEAEMQDAVKIMNSLNASMDDDDDHENDDSADDNDEGIDGGDAATLGSIASDGTGAQTLDEEYAQLKDARRKAFERRKSVRRDFYRPCMPSYVLSNDYPTAYKAALSQKMKGAMAFRKGQEFQAIQHFMEGMLQLVEGIPIFAIEEEIIQEGETEITNALLSNIVAAMVKPRVQEPVTATLFASFILQQDPTNVKIRFRRARAQMMLQLFGLASDDLGICEQAVLGDIDDDSRHDQPSIFAPPAPGIDSESAWREAYTRAQELGEARLRQRLEQVAGADLQKSIEDRRRQATELLTLRLELCAKSRELAAEGATSGDSDSAGESDGEGEDKGLQGRSRMFLPPRFVAICRRLRDAETVRASRRFLSARLGSRTLRNEVACCCIHLYRAGHWRSFDTCLSVVHTLVQQLGLDEDPTGFIFSDFLRVVSVQWSTEEQARLCWTVALPALLGGPGMPRASTGTALERSNAWLEVARFFQRYMGFVWPARRVHTFLDLVANGFGSSSSSRNSRGNQDAKNGGQEAETNAQSAAASSSSSSSSSSSAAAAAAAASSIMPPAAGSSSSTVWGRDVRREVRAYVMAMYRRHRQDSHHHMWRRYFHHEQLRMSQGQRHSSLVGPGGDRACSVEFGKITGSPVPYTTEAWRASQAQLSADRDAWRAGLQPWQVAVFSHENQSDAERIASTMSEKAIATLYGPVGWGGPGVLDTLRLHAIASASLQLNVVMQIERHQPSNPMYQFNVSPLQLWAWRGEDLVVSFILKHGQLDHINALDGGFFGTPATALDFCLAHQHKLQQCLRFWEELERSRPGEATKGSSKTSKSKRDIYRADDGEIRSAQEDRKTLQKLETTEAVLRAAGAKLAAELGERFDDVGMLD